MSSYRAATVTGRHHLFREANAQDAFAIRLGGDEHAGDGDRAREARGAQRSGPSPGGPWGAQPPIVDARRLGVAVVCDGCGSSPRSEFGATLLASALSAAALRHLAAGTPARALGPLLARHAVRALARAAHTLSSSVRGPAFERAVETHLLSTALVLAEDGEDLAVFAWGDGVIAIEDDVTVVDAGDAPPYLAYALLGERDASCPRFACTMPVRCARRVAIATDGLPAALVPGLWGHRGRGLARWLNVQASRVPLGDDATVVVREEEVAS